MDLGRWGALLDQLFQVWVYKYKNNLYCGQTNKHKLYLYCNLYGKQGVCHTMALPFTLKSILGQKKNYGNSKFFTMKKYNLQKIPLKETKILQDIITL
jgi:hypothetical protein